MALALLAGLAIARLGFGLSSEFWSEDERQTYLIGLRAFARHEWPYFGPDVVWSQSRLPGALEGLLIAIPLAVGRVPEAPFVIVNALSFAALAWFASYVSRRLPGLPTWLVWGWAFTAPWAMHFSTHIVNTSYVLPASLVFFVGFFESIPTLATGVVRARVAWAAMGVGLAAMVQLHMSWVLLPVYLALAAWRRWRLHASVIGGDVMAFLAGAAIPGTLLIPTLVHGGVSASGGTEGNIEFHPQTPWTLVTILARLLSFASPEVTRFIGFDTPQRAYFLASHPWLVPFGAVLLIAGVASPVMLLLAGVSSEPRQVGWRTIRALTAGTVALIYAAYFFSIKEPLAHAFYFAWPVAMLYAMYCADRWVDRRWVRRLMAGLLITNAVFLAGFAVARLPDRSLYRDRMLVQEAIDRRNDRLLGDRRQPGPAVRVLEPADDPATSRDALPPRNQLQVRATVWSKRLVGRISLFDVTIANTAPDLAYIDIRYRTSYTDAIGHTLTTREGVLKEILQPGAIRRWPELVDGLADSRAAHATFEILAAEPVVPATFPAR